MLNNKKYRLDFTMDDGNVKSVEFLAPQGDPGPAGYTPVKGVDYFTDADQEAIVQQVIAALGTPVFGRVDENNNIILTGALAEGSYTVKYEDAEGDVTIIGTLTNEAAPEYTNLLPRAINSDGSAYVSGDNGENKGWKPDTRLSSSGSESTSNATGIEVTGFIPVEFGQTIYFKNLTFTIGGEKASSCYLCLYDANFNLICYRRADETTPNGITVDENNVLKSIIINIGNGFNSSPTTAVAYFRISAEEITDASIITVNEPID